MEKLKKFGKNLLFPPTAVLLALAPVAVAFLVDLFAFPGESVAQDCLCYAIAAYTLVVWLARVPGAVARMQDFRHENRYLRRWTEDLRLRVSFTLYGSFTWNLAYGVFQLFLGLYHASSWYYSTAAYYICLAVMRFYLSRHTRRYEPGENRREELRRSRNCGWILLAMNLAISGMLVYMVSEERIVRHSSITAITMATYTFVMFARSIVNLLRARQYDSPLVSVTRIITLAAACVSMISLEATLLSTFAPARQDPLFRRRMLSISGSVVGVLILLMAIAVISRSTLGLKRAQQEE